MTTTPDHDNPSPAVAQPPAARTDTPPEPVVSASPDTPTRRRVRRTRIGSVWVGIIAAAVVLILLLIFILQNSQSVKISYLGMHGHLSLAVAMLLSAIAGILVVAIPGSARILQLRRGIRHHPTAKR